MIAEQCITRYQQPVYATVVQLVCGQEDVAYEITVAVFVDVLRADISQHAPATLWRQILQLAIERCRQRPATQATAASHVATSTTEPQGTLSIIRRALLVLSFEDKVPLLLRDQLHISYSEMAAVMRVPERDAKLRTLSSRRELRRRVQEVLHRGR